MAKQTAFNWDDLESKKETPLDKQEGTRFEPPKREVAKLKKQKIKAPLKNSKKIEQTELPDIDDIFSAAPKQTPPKKKTGKSKDINDFKAELNLPEEKILLSFIDDIEEKIKDHLIEVRQQISLHFANKIN